MEEKRVEVHLTELQKKIVSEMKNQGADRPTVNGIMARLKTEAQQNEMLEYLISIRNKIASKHEVIEKSLEIVGISQN